MTFEVLLRAAMTTLVGAVLIAAVVCVLFLVGSIGNAIIGPDEDGGEIRFGSVLVLLPGLFLLCCWLVGSAVLG
jgi:regulator of protease activity HflC (stomatin/prohibitin superfamily)